MNNPVAVNLTSNEVEVANRAEAIAILIRKGYRVYRPEADCYGEDLVIRTPSGDLCAVQLKSRPTVDQGKYGSRRDLWMLFPDRKPITARRWFLVPHASLYNWIKAKHGHAEKWNETWSCPKSTKALDEFLEAYEITDFQKK